MTALAEAAPVATLDEQSAWIESFLGSDTYLGRRGSTARTLDRSVDERRIARRSGRPCVANAQLSAPGAEGLEMPRDLPVRVSIWDHGNGWSSGYEGAMVKVHFSEEDLGEWVPRRWVKHIPA